MKLAVPSIEGVIDRRILVNFRIDPDRIQQVLPPRLQPQLVAGHAIGGICLIRLRDIRPVPLNVSQVTSSFFGDPARFPEGTVEFDDALLMRDIDHRWHQRESLCACDEHAVAAGGSSGHLRSRA